MRVGLATTGSLAAIDRDASRREDARARRRGADRGAPRRGDPRDAGPAGDRHEVRRPRGLDGGPEAPAPPRGVNSGSRSREPCPACRAEMLRGTMDLPVETVGGRDVPGGAPVRPVAASSIEALGDALRAQGYIADRSLATTAFLSLELGRPLLLEGEAGVGKTELAKALAAVLGARADPAPVLRGARRQQRRLRVELPAPDARDPAPGGARGDRPGDRARHLRSRVPPPPAAAAGPREPRRRAAGPAHRRGGPGRRGVRGLPARDPLRFPGHGPGDRDDPRRGPAARGRHLEPDARGPRRAEAPLPIPLDRLPVARARARDRAHAGAGGPGPPGDARSSRSSRGSGGRT